MGRRHAWILRTIQGSGILYSNGPRKMQRSVAVMPAQIHLSPPFIFVESLAKFSGSVRHFDSLVIQLPIRWNELFHCLDRSDYELTTCRRAMPELQKLVRIPTLKTAADFRNHIA